MQSNSSVEPFKHNRLIVGITGASGVVYGVRALEMLAQSGIESHLVMSKAAEMTIRYETDYRPADVKALAHQVYPIGDVGASISSGSYRTLGMLIVIRRGARKQSHTRQSEAHVSQQHTVSHVSA